MSKLTQKNKFIDVSDYGRPVASIIAKVLSNTWVTPIHITLLFGLSGCLAIFCIVKEYYWLALTFLVLKSILDAADGQLARINNRPSYTGRYLDSILDSFLNMAFLATIGWVTHTGLGWILLAFICMQTQGTLYNYYHVILRHRTSGEITSQVFETKIPSAYPEESQVVVNILFWVYRLLYKRFDELVYRLDPYAFRATVFPKWFMTLVSIYGLGFQLLLIGLFLVVGWINCILPFVIGFTVMIPLFVAYRRFYLK